RLRINDVCTEHAAQASVALAYAACAKERDHFLTGLLIMRAHIDGKTSAMGRHARRPALFVTALLAGLLAALPGVAQEKPEKPADVEKPKEVPPPKDPKAAKAEAEELGRAAMAISEAIALRRPIETLVNMSASPTWSKLLNVKKEPPRITQLFEKYPVNDG